ncbi:serine/threonine-protein kinase [Dokdonella sp.]|uniref:serine/threonine-protein kinase n=1 Tax=Dokdonella sp. TaxID=2291710 RepID=UPI001B1AE628|nr:serine/threonine-protein kinase [Dokdonella sp.]MBO9661640.1 serine/threonine protein kinase [Dokdonella sp.]
MTTAANDSVVALKLFEAALERPEAERRTWIEAAAASPAECAAALRLLDAHGASAGFLEPQAASTPTQLGPYRLLEPLGRGGMGQVWLAERRDGAFEQRVAIKVLASVLGDADSIRRAESERQFLAWLDHPHIARVLDGGATPHGQPYVVMEYVDGERIDAWCRTRALDLRSRIELFLQVLAAVDAAHRALIIHRDIKPANILVDAQGQAKLLDFGIAKSLDGRLAGATRTGLMPLTPEYASPEQLLDRPLTTACDVYALGLVLDELLTGRMLHAGVAPTERMRRIEASSPTRPSARVDAQALALPPRAAVEWKKRLGGDLDRVVLKALEAEPHRRYDSARAFADDLERWLAHRPVQARAGGFGYRAAKFARRNRWAVAGAGAALGALVLGGAAALYQAQRARAAAERAERANEFLVSIIGYSDPRVSNQSVRLVDALDYAALQIPAKLSDQPELEASIRKILGEAYTNLDRLDEAEQQLARAAVLFAPSGGTEYASTLDLQGMLAWRRDDAATAERLVQQAMTACRRDPCDLQQRATNLSDYSVVLGGTGRQAEALPFVEEALRLQESASGVDPSNLATTWSNLGAIRVGLGRFDAAQDAFARSTRLFESVVPMPELAISVNLNNQARLLQKLDRLAEAVPLQERAVALKRKVMGPDWPQLVRPLTSLAEYYAGVDRHVDAGGSMREALRLAPGLLAEDDADLGDLHERAAAVFLSGGDAPAAAAQAKIALAVYARAKSLEPGRQEKARATLAAATEIAARTH